MAGTWNRNGGRGTFPACRHRFFNHCIPFSTGRTPSHPLGTFIAASLAEPYRLCLYCRHDYSAFLQQSTLTLSQAAHLVLSQHSVLQESAFVQPSHSVHSVHSVAALAFFELLLHAHEAAANITATIANVINTFFIVTKIKMLIIHSLAKV